MKVPQAGGIHPGAGWRASEVLFPLWQFGVLAYFRAGCRVFVSIQLDDLKYTEATDFKYSRSNCTRNLLTPAFSQQSPTLIVYAQGSAAH
jgi:hypothetical protein